MQCNLKQNFLKKTWNKQRPIVVPGGHSETISHQETTQSFSNSAQEI